MQKTRKYLTTLTVIASLSLLAACSKSDDAPAPDSAGTAAPQPGAPTTPPAPAPAPAPSPSAPSTGQENAAPDTNADQTSMSDKASDAADSVAKTAGELTDSASKKLGEMGDAIKEGAASADQKIQDSVGNGTAGATPTTPTSNQK